MSLEPSDGKFKEFVLSLCLQDLLLKEISFLFNITGATLKVLNFLLLLILLFFHPHLVVSDALNGLLEIHNFLVLFATVEVLLVKFFDEFSQLFLLSFNEDVVGFQVLVFLFGKDEIKFFIKTLNSLINFLFFVLDFHVIDNRFFGFHSW